MDWGLVELQVWLYGAGAHNDGGLIWTWVDDFGTIFNVWQNLFVFLQVIIFVSTSILLMSLLTIQLAGACRRSRILAVSENFLTFSICGIWKSFSGLICWNACFASAILKVTLSWSLQPKDKPKFRTSNRISYICKRKSEWLRWSLNYSKWHFLVIKYFLWLKRSLNSYKRTSGVILSILQVNHSVTRIRRVREYLWRDKNVQKNANLFLPFSQAVLVWRNCLLVWERVKQITVYKVQDCLPLII